MSRIFSISGRLIWIKNSPGLPFHGKIVVDDDGVFYGFCDKPLNGYIYLIGTLTEEGFGKGSKFYMLSNNPKQAPIIYIMLGPPDSEDGMWGIVFYFYAHIQGEAKITVKEEVFSKEVEDSIKTKYDTLDRNANGNGEIVERIYPDGTC